MPNGTATAFAMPTTIWPVAMRIARSSPQAREAMLTARSIVLCAIGGAVLAILATLISVFQPPSPLGEDTYGTRAYGYKAVYETMSALGIEQQRESAPPSQATAKTDTYVLWAPQPNFVQMEPVYLERLRQWVRDGGRIVLSPQANRDRPQIA